MRHLVSFRRADGGEYNITVNADPDASDEGIIAAATSKAGQALRRWNRGDTSLTSPTVIRATR